MNEKEYHQKSAGALTEDDLRVNGICYQLDFTRLEARLGPDAEQYVFDIVLQGLEDLKELCKGKDQGSYLAWMLKRGIVSNNQAPTLGFLVILTPADQKIFPMNPVGKQLEALPEFIRMQGITPLYEGAVPFFQYSDGEIFCLERNVDFLKFAAMVLGKVMKETKNWESNIYREVLHELNENDSRD